MSGKSDPKGEFSADISEELVAEALRAVEERAEVSANERAEEQALDEAAFEIGGEDADADGVNTVEVLSVEAEGGTEAGAEDPIARIAALEAELRAKEELLEESLQRGREMMERLQEASDRITRQAADFDNARKRALREKEEGQRFAIEKLLRELIPVLDNFDRALEHADASVDLKTFAQGVAMTQKHFVDTLGKFGVAGFQATGELFDPNFHEAMEHVESAEHPANVVVSEMVRGYKLHDRLIRPALVSVSKGPGKEQDPAEAQAAEAESGAAAEAADEQTEPASAAKTAEPKADPIEE